MNRLCFPVLVGMSLLVAGCGGDKDDTPLTVSAIGGAAEAIDPSRSAMPFPDAVLMAATAQGLVRFDAGGQVEPGLAESWIVIDDGRTYIFRLGDARWADGSPVTAQAVVRVLDRARAAKSRNPLAASLAVIEDITAMTPEVVEIQLKQPRPDLLRLLAAPELAIFQTSTLSGSGPFRVRRDPHPGILLRELVDAPLDDGEEPDDATPPPQARLFGERSALAIARFKNQLSDVVLGGTFRDWPLLDIAGIADPARRVDPAEGLFGLSIVERRGFLADADGRAALAMAIDREELLGALRGNWSAVETVLPQQLDSATPPVRPDWVGRSLDDRRKTASARVAVWKAGEVRAGRSVAPIRVAVPDGPGGAILWSHIGRAINSIGLSAQRVAMRADADLRVIDEVAPYENARWYLNTACSPCSDATEKLLSAVSEASDLEHRAKRLGEADAAVTAETPFIPIAEPLRWSLVGPRVEQWQANSRAWHPLNHLLAAPR